MRKILKSTLSLSITLNKVNQNFQLKHHLDFLQKFNNNLQMKFEWSGSSNEIFEIKYNVYNIQNLSKSVKKGLQNKCT